MEVSFVGSAILSTTKRGLAPLRYLRIVGAEPFATELYPPCFDSFENDPTSHNTNPPYVPCVPDGGP